MAKGDNMFFTTVRQPRSFRRSLLESSKEIITVLKEYHVLLEMRKEKESKINDLKKEFEELNELLEKLDGYVPEEAVKELEAMMPKPVSKPKPKPKKTHKKTTKKAPKKKDSKKKEEPSKPESPIDKLEKMLSQIEEKLEKV